MARGLSLPLAPGEARDLALGDEVLLSGRLVTGRAAAHRHLVEGGDPRLGEILGGAVLYHCGPVVARDPSGGWRFVAAGPAASMGAEPWAAEVIARYRPSGLMGKGGMGPATRRALQEHGAVYLHATGSLAVVLARSVVAVRGVHLLAELGAPDALWEIEVRDFPAVVTMDARGGSLHELAEPTRLARQLMG